MFKSRIFLGLLLLSAAYIACKKNDPFNSEAQLAIDTAKIREFLDTSGITATKDPSGLFYLMVVEGEDTAATPSLEDSIRVAYTGRILGDTTAFETVTESAPRSYLLSQRIEGWRTGLSMTKEGGQIRLFIPSSLAYRDFVQSGIPANTILDFTIDLLKVVKKK
ncbi:FkpA protein [Pedobacter sp. BAL39]|uniref:FKBP-type peptidyl-prolyl cis-trans isomerase n=1 Tax=Pedobacter sp. BAL39 TaxID=391596 RepID=UPI000155994F|nr:FKBP-type peptidyl-prolyl cis-trans isomerase [Pedobacter sp. BAL39]EDM35721.1 FkpA protein [Pedobacter sp. BAL39]